MCRSALFVCVDHRLFCADPEIASFSSTRLYTPVNSRIYIRKKEVYVELRLFLLHYPEIVLITPVAQVRSLSRHFTIEGPRPVVCKHGVCKHGAWLCRRRGIGTGIGCAGCKWVGVWWRHVAVVLTFTHIIKSVVTGQAPVTLEWKNIPGKKTRVRVVTKAPVGTGR